MKDIIIIGGGIIGLCTAEKLISEGHKITIVEKSRIAAGASYGNAAGFAFSEVMPMASFSTIRQSTKWFFDPDGPFSVVLADLPYTWRWLIKFAWAARKSVFDRSLKVQSELMQLGQKTLPLMLARAGLESMVKTTGALYLYDTPAEFKAAHDGWKLRADLGVEHVAYEGQALHDFQPGLSKNIYAGIHAPNYQCVSNPNDFCLAIHSYLSQKGVKTVYAKVVDICPQESQVQVFVENGESLKGDTVVIAAGPWSGELSKALGDKVPLVGERGYNTTLPKSSMPELRYPIFFGPHGFVMSPLSNGVRIGGASEIARIDRAPNFRRSEVMLRRAKKLVPTLQLAEGEQWMGMRPTTPDTLPVISQASQHFNVIYAFGHGHLGLTQSTATAQLVAEFVRGHSFSIALAKLSVKRFKYWRR